MPAWLPRPPRTVSYDTPIISLHVRPSLSIAELPNDLDFTVRKPLDHYSAIGDGVWIAPSEPAPCCPLGPADLLLQSALRISREAGALNVWVSPSH